MSDDIAPRTTHMKLTEEGTRRIVDALLGRRAPTPALRRLAELVRDLDRRQPGGNEQAPLE